MLKKKQIIEKQIIKLEIIEQQLKSAEAQIASMKESLSKADQPEQVKKLQQSNLVLNEKVKEHFEIENKTLNKDATAMLLDIET